MGLFCCFCLFFNYNFYLEEARENSGYGLKQVGKIYFSRKHDEGLRTHSLAPTEKKKKQNKLPCKAVTPQCKVFRHVNFLIMITG